jgi:hypothetical protein
MDAKGSPEQLVLIKNESIALLLDYRHVLDQEIKRIIHNAEARGEKLYQPEGDKYLAKMEITNTTFYVEYSVASDGYMIHTAYFHRSKIIEG